jgi:uncharacterized protein YdeI (YjbR/CyaY-like superfamily)
MDAIFFESPSELRQWLADNHDKASELLVGFYKKNSHNKGITYAEMLDEALCFGWIDGVRRTLDETRWTIRLTPRKPGSIWSRVNVKRANELIELGRMQPPGLKAFSARDQNKTNLYSYERDNAQFGSEYEARFRANEKAWDFFQAQPPSYRKAATWWVISAKQEATRLKRLAILIEDSENGRRLAAVTYTPKRQQP